MALLAMREDIGRGNINEVSFLKICQNLSYKFHLKKNFQPSSEKKNIFLL